MICFCRQSFSLSADSLNGCSILWLHNSEHAAFPLQFYESWFFVFIYIGWENVIMPPRLFFTSTTRLIDEIKNANHRRLCWHTFKKIISAPLNRICTQTSSVRTLSYHLVDKLDCGFVWDGLNLYELRETECFFFSFQGDKRTWDQQKCMPLKLRLALFILQVIWGWFGPKTERLCLFGSVSETAAQPICSLVQCVLSQYLQHTVFLSIFIWGHWHFFCSCLWSERIYNAVLCNASVKNI